MALASSSCQSDLLDSNAATLSPADARDRMEDAPGSLSANARRAVGAGWS